MLNKLRTLYLSLLILSRAEIPSRNALTNAHDLAVIAGLLASKGSDQILSQEAKEKMHQDPTVGYPLGGLKTFFTQVLICDFDS